VKKSRGRLLKKNKLKSRRKENKMEAGYTVLLCVIAIVAGVLIGWSIAKIKSKADQPLGFLYVIEDAPAGQDLFLTPTVSTSTIASKKRVIFDVDVIRQNSHK
jgi:hypothetical protein